MPEVDFTRESERIWKKADAHLKKAFEFMAKGADGKYRPLDYPGFGEAACGLLESLLDLYGEMRALEERTNRMPDIRLKTYREFLHVLKARAAASK